MSRQPPSDRHGPPPDVTLLLSRASRGDTDALNDAFALLRDRVHAEARALIGQRSPGQALDATDLLHEAFLRSAQASARDAQRDPDDEPRWKDREHFVLAQVLTMKNLLVDSARRGSALKRGGGHEHLLVDESVLDPHSDRHDTVFVDDACSALAAKEPLAAQLVDLHYFGGLTWEEAGNLLDLPVRKRKALVAFAKTWLLKELAGQ